MPTAFGPALRSAWMLDPELLYLNHGTVGAPPRAVLAAQQAIRDEIERDPAQFLLRELADTDGLGSPAVPRMRAAAARVAGFLGTRDPSPFLATPAALGHTRDDAMRLRAALHDEDRIEIPIYPGPAQLSLRFSAQIYVDLDDVDHLADAVLARC